MTTSFSYREVRTWDLAANSQMWAFDHGGGNPWAIRAQFTSGDGSVITSFGEVQIAVERGTRKKAC